jgi:YihY family inner membrane protein
MSTASEVPVTHGELEGDEALETLREAGRRRLVRDSADRFRAADAFSHSRALAFQLTLTLLPALIALVGLAAAVDERTVTRVVEDTLRTVAPGAAGDLLTQALGQGRAARREGALALVVGGAAALVAGATAMGQVERGANRIYGVERDRPLLRKYAVGTALAATAGVLSLLAVAVLLGGDAIRRAAGWGETVQDVWAVARWPLGVALVGVAVSLLFEVSPRRRQPEASWLAFGAVVAGLLWLASMGALALLVEVSDRFGATYGPLAGTVAVLLWAFACSVSLFGGLAFAAQLEALRAGAPGPRRPDAS